MRFNKPSTTLSSDLLLLIGLIAMVFACTGCASLPPPPQGNLCLFDAHSMESVCRAITPAIVQTGLEAQPVTVVVEAKRMQGWITTDARSWYGIQIYINELKQLATEKCQP